MLQNGTVVLGGWDEDVDPITFDRCDREPVCTSFQVLNKTEQELCEQATAELFKTEMLPPSLRPTGRLHRMTMTCGAALLMTCPLRVET